MPDAGSYIEALTAVLAVVRRQHSLVVELPAAVADSVRALGQLAPADSAATRPSEPGLTLAHHSILAVIDAGTKDLARLVAVGASDAISDLGYALHNLPRFLDKPEDFCPQHYTFSFGIAARHWHELAPPMRDALCTIVGRAQAESVLLRVGRCPQSGPSE